MRKFLYLLAFCCLPGLFQAQTPAHVDHYTLESMEFMAANLNVNRSWPIPKYLLFPTANPAVLIHLNSPALASGKGDPLKLTESQFNLLKTWVKEDLDKLGIRPSMVVSTNRLNQTEAQVGEVDNQLRLALYNGQVNYYLQVVVNIIPSAKDVKSGVANRTDFVGVTINIVRYKGQSVVGYRMPKSGDGGLNALNYKEAMDMLTQAVEQLRLRNNGILVSPYLREDHKRNRGFEYLPEDLADQTLLLTAINEEEEKQMRELFTARYPHAFAIVRQKDVDEKILEKHKYLLVEKSVYKRFTPTDRKEKIMGLAAIYMVFDTGNYDMYQGASMKQLTKRAEADPEASMDEKFAGFFALFPTN